jgi:hypothetical protein
LAEHANYGTEVIAQNPVISHEGSLDAFAKLQSVIGVKYVAGAEDINMCSVHRD